MPFLPAACCHQRSASSGTMCMIFATIHCMYPNTCSWTFVLEFALWMSLHGQANYKVIVKQDVTVNPFMQC